MSDVYEMSNAFPAGFKEALGELVVLTGRLEYLLKVVFKRLSGKKFESGFEEAEKIKPFEELCKRIKQLYALKEADQQKVHRFTELIDDVQQTWTGPRNDMVHCFWAAHDVEYAAMIRPKLSRKASGLRKVDWRMEHVSPFKVLRLCDKVNAQIWRLQDMTHTPIPVTAEN